VNDTAFLLLILKTELHPIKLALATEAFCTERSLALKLKLI
jgi:hypothetical protein